MWLPGTGSCHNGGMSGGGLVGRRTVLRDKAGEGNQGHLSHKSVGHVKIKFIRNATEAIKGLNNEGRILGT